ncbi:MAG: MupG family TIM beta-alpha barrel fold protein [Erysipelotrichaceae bacterium]|nr:MupG family TIM beta-alpha barrel fold protein [Erysipelotrichaceae bacterium]MDY5252614.1 MupG family TIM beta-alpha barrel fold protein [Erysipelotrichaceae bacterium]
MRRLGISIYPEKSDKTTILNYIDKAAKAGFTRIFSCLLSVEKSKEEIKQDFLEINQYAKDKGFEIIVDVSPRVFDQLGISYKDLSFFHEIGADGLRLDAGFSGNEEALMTFNPYGLIIEINMSNNVHTIDTIMDYKPDRYKLYGCHNFYPHGYSGLKLDFFLACTKRFSQYGIKTAAFVTSQNQNTFGSWPVTEGLPTLEMHRHLPLDVQIKHMIALENIDDIIISNCYPSDEELQNVADLDLSLVTFDVEMVDGVPEIEQKILFEELHFNRGDQNANMIRSTQSRVKYKGHNFALFNAPAIIHRGDVIIESSEYGHYAGELQIALHDMKNSGMTNVVGKIVPEEHFILDQIAPWQKFRLRKAK